MGLSTVMIAPTSQSALPSSFRPEIEIAGARSRILVEQLRSLDLRSFGAHVGRLDPAEQAALDEALRYVLGLT
jgi:mRNA interferase MazF